MANLRVTSVVSEAFTRGAANLRANVVVGEAPHRGYPNLRVTEVVGEGNTRGYPLLRVTVVCVELFCPVDPEAFMATEYFPGFGNSATDPVYPAAADPFNTALPGLSITVKKRPNFATQIATSASGFEVRNALQEFPRWDVELSYEFLEDRSGADSSLKTILGFFLARLGSYESWLFKDPDDYLVVNGWCGEPDGVTTTFQFYRTIGAFHERIGQVDEANTITLYLTIEEATNIPATPGPYTVTVTEAASFVEDLGVTKGGVPMTKVTSGLGTGEYMVDENTGIYTFAAADEADAIVISYRYEIDPADYTITLPYRITFDSAPPAGILTADFQFFFVCRFIEDQMEFEKFADKLWNLQTCEFRSLIE